MNYQRMFRGVLVGVLLLGLVTPAAAQTTTQKTFREQLQETKNENRKRLEEQQRALREKASAIKDTAKRAAIERVGEKLNSSNAQLVERYGSYLDRLTAVLEKIEERAARAEDAGTDTTSTGVAIADARAVIESAREAALTLGAKIYTVPDSATTKNLGQALSALVAELRADHKNIRDGALTAARAAVQNASKALRITITGESEPEPAENE